MPGSEVNKSFFFATDYRYGWGNISFFTYLSEFNRPWRGLAYVEAAVITVLFVLSTAGNVFIVGFIFKTRRRTTITNCFVANLAMADTLFGCSAPLIAYVRITENWSLGAGMCSILCYEMLLCGFVMLWTMAAISIDRYICINLTPARRMSRAHVRLTCVGIWLFAVMVFIPLSVFFNIKTVRTHTGVITFCTLLWPKANVNLSILFIVFLLVFGFGFPLTVTVTNYCRILKKFWISKRAVEQSASNPPGNSESGMARRKRNMHMVKTLIILVFLFVIMWSPVFTAFALIQNDLLNSVNNISSSVLIWAIVVAYLNACINPFLYGVINVDIQRSCLYCCRCQTSDGHIAVISNAELY